MIREIFHNYVEGRKAREILAESRLAEAISDVAQMAANCSVNVYQVAPVFFTCTDLEILKEHSLRQFHVARGPVNGTFYWHPPQELY